ncbi:MAG: NADPH:quinone oxidoreductase family protein [Flavobacteriales bacterium]|nr:NADPH:quinone oxidoreductase family protein [Flavobacteriales bacterium]
MDAMINGMKVQVSEFAETPMEGVEQFLSIVAQEMPNTEELGDDDVLIAVKSAALGWVDLMMLSGQYQHQPPLPYTPGLEYCGIVLWKGKNVSDAVAKTGDKVLVDGFISGPRSPGEYQRYGGFASYAVAPKEAIIHIPQRLNYDQACNLLGSYETAYYCLITSGQLKAGETVLIHGASGAIGMAAVHVAKLMGATVIATGRSEEKLAIVKAQGADHVINTKAIDPNEKLRPFRDDVKALTNGKGVDVVYDGVGGAVSEESLRCVKFGARFLIVGWASTPFVAKGKGQRGAPNANQLPTNLILMKGLKVLGSPMVIATQHDPSIRTQRLKDILQWVNEGKITPYVSDVFPLADIKEAMRAKWNGKIVGGAAVQIS